MPANCGVRIPVARARSYASYEAPVGHHGLTLGASYADYHYELCCEFTALDRSGDASVAGINARYPLLLNQRSVLNIGLSLQKKQPE